MIVEFTGCTSAGKSTYAQATTDTLCSMGLHAASASCLLTQTFRLGFIKNITFKNSILDILLLVRTIFFLGKYFKFYVWGFKILFHKPDSYLGAINRIRSIIRKTATYEFLSKTTPPDQIVIVDEGIVHSAHNLFVYSDCPLTQENITGFFNRVPLPDSVICLKVTKEIILHRISTRKDRRMRFESKTLIPKYISRAIELFDMLCRCDKLIPRLLLLPAQGDIADPDNRNVSRIVSFIIDANTRLKNQTSYLSSDHLC